MTIARLYFVARWKEGGSLFPNPTEPTEQPPSKNRCGKKSLAKRDAWSWSKTTIVSTNPAATEIQPRKSADETFMTNRWLVAVPVTRRVGRPLGAHGLGLDLATAL